MKFIALLFLVAGVAQAQGLLPPQTQSAQLSSQATSYLMIGDIVPKTLTVTDADGNLRPIVSYKTATDLLVVGFFSSRCEAKQAAWNDVRRLYDAYNGWDVSFLAVSANTGESLGELSGAMKTARLWLAVARDESRQAAQALHITAAPQIVVLNEWGQLRYRGPVKEAVKALEALVGHEETGFNPEPAAAGGCPLQ